MKPPRAPSVTQLRRVVVQKLEDLQRAGVTRIAKGVATTADSAATLADGAATIADSATSIADSATSIADGATTIADGATADSAEHGTLSGIGQEVAACTACAELAQTRTQTVFGVGNPSARLCFLGEAPGAEEDRRGEPFVGAAGQLLTDIIEKGMGLRREDVYILNVLKCRPPGNRNPHPSEVANCRGFLDRQLALLQPQFICCLGAVAAQNLLDTTLSISRMRGTRYSYRGISVICTYHPAYLLRTPSAKKKTWEDIQFLLAEMGLPIPNRADQSRQE